MSENDDALRSGFLSEADKRKFTTVAGILGAAFFVFQFIVPMIAMFALMPSMMFGGAFKAYAVSGAALYQGDVHMVETTLGMRLGDVETSGVRLVRAGREGIQEVAVLDNWQPQLLADAERLWLISASRLSVLSENRLTPLESSETLGNICRPFLLEGTPAVVESRPDGGRLLSWKSHGWVEVRSIPYARGRCAFQALAVNGSVWLFQRDGETLYAQVATAESPTWEVVLSRPSEWYAFTRDGRPAVAASSSEEGFRVATHDGARWNVTATARTRLGLVDELAAFQERAGDPLVVVTSGFPGSLTLRTWNETGLTTVEQLGSPFPFPRGMMWIMMLPQVAAILLSLLLAVILSTMMRAHRVATYRHDGVEVTFASLTRRALSQIIDGLILVFPAVFGFRTTMRSFEELLEAGPAFPLRLLAWMGVWLLWMTVVFVAFSLSEGRWGTTPGKWLLGIRVVGTDLAPCGFGRALIRNLLKLIDGFFNYLVGILLMAFTPDWQRVGDLAARTIVIRVPPRA